MILAWWRGSGKELAIWLSYPTNFHTHIHPPRIHLESTRHDTNAVLHKQNDIRTFIEYPLREVQKRRGSRTNVGSICHEQKLTKQHVDILVEIPIQIDHNY